MEVNESQRLFALGLRPQDDYDTPTDASDPENFVALQFTDKDTAKLTPGLADNADDAHGSEFPSEEFVESWDTEAPHSIAVSSEMIGYILLGVFGQVVTDQPDAANHPLVYRHVFTLQDHNVSRQNPVWSLAEILGGAHNVLHPSMLMKALSMKGDGKKRIDASVQFHGSGREVAPSGLTWSQVKALVDAQALHYFFNTQCKATVADVGTLLNAENLSGAFKFRSWEFGVDLDPDAESGYAPGAEKWMTAGDATSGAVRAEMQNGIRKITASQVIRLRDQTERLALKTRKALDWQLNMKGGKISGPTGGTTKYHELTVELAKVRYSALDLQSGGQSPMTQQIQMKAFDVSTVVKATLINTVESYTD